MAYILESAVYEFENYLSSKGITRKATVSVKRRENTMDGFQYSVSINISNGLGGDFKCKRNPNVSTCLRLIAQCKPDNQLP